MPNSQDPCFVPTQSTERHLIGTSAEVRKAPGRADSDPGLPNGYRHIRSAIRALLEVGIEDATAAGRSRRARALLRAGDAIASAPKVG